MLLAGDVGGTKTVLGVYDSSTYPPSQIDVARFETLQFDGLAAIVETFLAGRHLQISAACFGVAGPVHGHVARLTNVPWRIDASVLARALAIPHVQLLNDVEAMGYAVPTLDESQLDILQDGERREEGNAALVAPGTGLGETLLHNVAGHFIPAASEGGHADFAARTPREQELAAFLTRAYGRASYEHVLTGPGSGDASPLCARRDELREGVGRRTNSRAAIAHHLRGAGADVRGLCRDTRHVRGRPRRRGWESWSSVGRHGRCLYRRRNLTEDLARAAHRHVPRCV